MDLEKTARGGGKSSVEDKALRLLYDLEENHAHRFSEISQGTSDPKLRISAPKEYRTDYESIISQGPEALKKQTKLAVANKIIDEFVVDKNRSSKDLENYFEFITGRLEISCLYLPAGMNPNRIFETINSRGKPLEAIDLIRNYFYSHFFHDKEQQRNIHNQIECMRDVIIEGDPRNSDRFGQYTRCYFQNLYGFINERQLYQRVVEEVDHYLKKAEDNFPPDINEEERIELRAEHVRDLINDWTKPEYAQIYKAISFAEAGDLCEAFNRDTGRPNDGRDLQILLHELAGYKVARPVLFALVFQYCQACQLDDQERKNMAKNLRKMFVQFNSYLMRVILSWDGNFRPSNFEKLFSHLAHKIFLWEDMSSFNMMESLRGFEKESPELNAVINNQRFIEKIKTKKQFDEKKAKLMLSAIVGFNQRDLRPQIDIEQKFTLEHILPQAEQYQRGWPKFPYPEDYVGRLGNMTLLHSGDNLPGSWNSDFRSKKAVFSNSDIRLNKDLARKRVWRPKDIEDRQEELAEMAVKVWNFPK